VKHRIEVAYNGTSLHGWQAQPGVATVEGALLEACARLLNVPREVVEAGFHGASRTDAGVHAVGQVAHITHAGKRDAWDFVRGLNALTPDAICVLRAEQVDEAFHARHDARGKRYRYTIWNARFMHPLWLGQAWHVPQPLDAARMHEAAQQFLGEHDFAGFRAADCQAQTTVRAMWRVACWREQDVVYVEVEGSAFLKNMVRIMVGTLAEIGVGRMEPERIGEVLRTQARGRGGPTAPPGGLCLMELFYPAHPWSVPRAFM
jgi:tRNA pseudouridine38-40 synthase